MNTKTLPPTGPTLDDLIFAVETGCTHADHLTRRFHRTPHAIMQDLRRAGRTDLCNQLIGFPRSDRKSRAK